jgi:hypothetical protein
LFCEHVAAVVEPSKMIDERIRELGDWRGPVLTRVRELIHEADRGKDSTGEAAFKELIRAAVAFNVAKKM